MRIDEKIRDEKMQKLPKESALSSVKIDKNVYLTCKEMLPSGQCRMVKQAKSTFSSLRKAFKTQIKAVSVSRKKKVEALKVLRPNEQKFSIDADIPKDQLNKKAKNEIEKLLKNGKYSKKEDSIYKTDKYVYNS